MNWRGVLLLSALCFFVACGKVGDPLPPIPRAPLIVNELAATQQGTSIIISFPVAKETLTDKLKRVDIYRLIEPTTAPLGITAEDYAARAALIASLPEEQLPTDVSVITYVDPIDFKIANDQTRYRYAVRLVNRDDRAADLSNYATLTPLSTVAEPPLGLKANVTQTQMEITWQPPAANLSGSQPANVLGYNLYRREGNQFVLVNKTPLPEPRYVEKQFQFGTTYEYIVRALSLPRPGAPLSEVIESNESLPLKVTPQDTFPPTAPTSISIASRGGIISLFWPPNPEPDVVGYNVYRSEDEQTWTKITPRPITTITFADRQVQIGKRYFYKIAAVDNAGNESPRSETRSEVAEPN
ncbi:MAG TPA: fibronectin type III domain-containing protein [Blastocatellia bacterium]|nr:fibronectin type III domain-containing protein [Blastocatellia bacterium]